MDRLQKFCSNRELSCDDVMFQNGRPLNADVYMFTKFWMNFVGYFIAVYDKNEKGNACH